MLPMNRQFDYWLSDLQCLTAAAIEIEAPYYPIRRIISVSIVLGFGSSLWRFVSDSLEEAV